MEDVEACPKIKAAARLENMRHTPTHTSAHGERYLELNGSVLRSESHSVSPGHYHEPQNRRANRIAESEVNVTLDKQPTRPGALLPPSSHLTHDLHGSSA